MKLDPQLRLRHSLNAIPSARPLPEGYSLRTATLDDTDAIGLVLEAAFNDPWPFERVRGHLLENVGVPLTFVIEQDGRIVGTASYQEKPEPDPYAGWLHWVGVHPDAQGKRLGEFVSHRVLTEAVNRNRSCVYLTTDDFKIPAIRTYLRLGFEPDMWHPSHPHRWDALKPQIL